MYLPLSQRPVSSMVVMVETTTRDPASLGPAARRAVRAIDEDVPITDIRPLATALGDSMARRRLFARVLSFFGGLALVLAAVGVYGVMAYAMRARRPEFGIRLALGATRAEVVRSAFGRGLVPVFVGLAAGLTGAFVAGRLLRSLLYGITAGDPVTLAASAAVLAGVAATAIALPAYRLTGVDAASVLRAD